MMLLVWEGKRSLWNPGFWIPSRPGDDLTGRHMRVLRVLRVLRMLDGKPVAEEPSLQLFTAWSHTSLRAD
jgi:hypothetical protein